MVPLVFRGEFGRRRESVFYLIGLLGLFGLLGKLLISPEASLLPLSPEMLEVVYTGLPFVVAGLAIWWSIRRQSEASTYISATVLALYTLVKYFDWFWGDWPHYLFFLLLGAISVAVIIVLRRLRHLMRAAS